MLEQCAGAPADYAHKAQAIREKYLPIYYGHVLPPDGKTFEDILEDWCRSTATLLAQYEYTRTDVVSSPSRIVGGILPLRDGMKDMFSLFAARDIAPVILSAGLGDVIEAVLEQHGLYSGSQQIEVTPSFPTEVRPSSIPIVANFLSYSPSGQVSGYQNTTLVHPHNKDAEHCPPHIRTQIDNTPFHILIGDHVGDSRMLACPKKREDSLKIAFNNQKERPEHHARLMEAFDVVITDAHSVGPLLPLFREIFLAK